jgi:hypothetical protein
MSATARKTKVQWSTDHDLIEAQTDNGTIWINDTQRYTAAEARELAEILRDAAYEVDNALKARREAAGLDG